MNTVSGGHRDNGEPDLNALAALVDGRLDPAARADLTVHLAGCPQCRAIVAELARDPAPAVRSRTPVLATAASVGALLVGGGIYLLVHDRERAAAVPPPVLRPTTPVAAPPAPSRSAPGTAASSPSSPTSPSPPPDRTRAAGTTSVSGKTFHLVAGEWIDDAYRENDFLPTVEVSSRRQLDATPALRRYAALGSRFVVVIHGTVYRVSLP